MTYITYLEGEEIQIDITEETEPEASEIEETGETIVSDDEAHPLEGDADIEEPKEDYCCPVCAHIEAIALAELEAAEEIQEVQEYTFFDKPFEELNFTEGTLLLILFCLFVGLLWSVVKGVFR